MWKYDSYFLKQFFAQDLTSVQTSQTNVKRAKTSQNSADFTTISKKILRKQKHALLKGEKTSEEKRFEERESWVFEDRPWQGCETENTEEKEK